MHRASPLAVGCRDVGGHAKVLRCQDALRIVAQGQMTVAAVAAQQVVGHRAPQDQFQPVEQVLAVSAAQPPVQKPPRARGLELPAEPLALQQQAPRLQEPQIQESQRVQASQQQVLRARA